MSEITVMVRAARSADGPYLLVGLSCERGLLKRFHKGYKDILIDSGQIHANRIPELLSGELDDHVCLDSDNEICTVSGLWILRDRDLADVVWYILVNLAKLALETNETQEFTLTLDE